MRRRAASPAKKVRSCHNVDDDFLQRCKMGLKATKPLNPLCFSNVTGKTLLLTENYMELQVLYMVYSYYYAQKRHETVLVPFCSNDQLSCVCGRGDAARKGEGGKSGSKEIRTLTHSFCRRSFQAMDAFEGIHSVQIGPPSPVASTSGLGYELLVTGTSGIAVYSSPAFFGKPVITGWQASSYNTAEEERCPVGRLIDLDPDPGPSGRSEGGRRTETMPQGDDGACAREHINVSRLRSSSLEIREKGTEFLREQLDAAQKELKLKDEECERLAHIRDQLERELEELTASLFEEAHKMVREANVKQAAAEKQLKEAQGKIDVLQAEVTALKTLVLTSTPSSPNRQLHPQLLSPGSRGAAMRHGGHTRSRCTSSTLTLSSGPSDPSLQSPAEGKEDRESAVPALLSMILCLVPGHSVSLSSEPYGQETGEVPGVHGGQLDSVLFAEFLLWKEAPSLDRSSAFMSRVYREDIGPCLSFTRTELSHLVQSAVENNSLTIEPVAMTALPMVKASAIECGGPKKCALSGLSRPCKHRIKLGDKETYYYISPSSRARITAVCNFFTYIRYIQQGLVRQDVEQMFWEVIRLRREMTVAKLGFFLIDDS
ncbi:guanine nucleotide exchange factor for Rab-3A isoform X2 [Denticeps clupeoides]|uniref:GDP/GTP exchange factor Sec2 N-terminal domain-containing protein n=1 Tax=Denticeps clupeoides TaxID=299321 RepID=A0AAY4DGX3_9TELE|nr:guanine nucleotide exchange factor for Rab-3A-like isoform X2 [Denticeps clupeoides]